MIPQDPARGRLLFEYAAALGNGAATVIATNLMGNGVAGRRDWPMALARLEAEARQLPERMVVLDLIREMDLDDNGDPRGVTEAKIIANRPFAQLFQRALTSDECAYLMQVADPLFQPSMIYRADGQATRDSIRTSDGAALHWLIEDPAVHALNRRIAKITSTRYLQGEALQVLRYSPGQEYRPHFDFLEGAENPRPLTALIYLNDEYEGGETSFVETDVRVRGRTGDVLVFRNEGGEGQRDPWSKHAGQPVTAGTKYLATRWIRERRWIP